MASIRVAAERVIAAPPARVYELIADYRNGHPRILPPEYFGTLTVERGGRGAGTRICFEMKALGRVNVAAGEVTEPVPGRELRETLDDGIVTTFRVDPGDDGTTRVTIETAYDRPGFRGLVESILAPRYLGKVYAAELVLLAREATRAT